MKIISWNCQGAGKSIFPVYCWGLKHSYHPHVMVLMETKVSKARAERIIPTFGFSNHFKVPSESFAGGIQVLWDENIVSGDCGILHPSYACHYSFNDLGEWLFSSVYSSPITCKKKVLWEDFQNISTQESIPWLVARDFDEGLFNFYKANVFDRRINDCNLIDQGWHGSPFTQAVRDVAGFW